MNLHPVLESGIFAAGPSGEFESEIRAHRSSRHAGKDPVFNLKIKKASHLCFDEMPFIF